VDPTGFQLTYFKVNDIRVKNVFDELERNTSEAVRGDREMSTCEMLEVIRDADREETEALRDRRELLVGDLRALLALPPLTGADTSLHLAPSPAYCGWIRSVQELVLPKTAEAQSAAQSKGRRVTPPKLRPPTPRPRPGGLREPPLSNWSLTATALDRGRDAERRAARYAVEVHKKWAISMACISFVIIGIVMALRFPRGGIGLVIGGGLLVFSIHYVGLTAGESLADRAFVTPWAAMWTPNIALTIVGVLGLIKVNRESGSTRGGDFQEVMDAIRHVWRRLRQRWAEVRGSA
jgi:lipopolysaccharide export system permease protein